MTTLVACPAPILRFTDNAGNPCVGGSVLTQVGGVNTPTYADVNGTTTLPNPIPLNSRGEVSTAAGASAQLFLEPNTAYTFTLSDAAGNQLWTATYVNGVQLDITQALIGETLWPQTAAETAASVTPVNYYYAPGNVLRYGTNTVPGSTDMTAAIQAALNQAAESTGVSAYLPRGTYLVPSTTLTIDSGVHFYGDGPESIINFGSTANQDAISGTTVTGTVVEMLKLVILNQQAGGSYTGVIAFRDSSENCKVINCDISGATSSGVLINASNSCEVRGNYFHDFIYGTGVNDSSDIHIMSDVIGGVNTNSSFNIIVGNQCFGGNNIGISMETSATPDGLMTKNIVSGNRVGTHTAYGIIAYSHQAGDTYNEIVDNYIESISGSSSSQGGTTGAGIYVAGMSGVKVANNVIYNCCTATSAPGLAPGGIGLNLASGGAPVDVIGNTILDMAQGNSTSGLSISGIYITTNSGSTITGVNVTGNTVSQQVAGGLSYGIYVSSQLSNVNISGNLVNILSSISGTRGIMVDAVSANIQGVAICGNTVVGCATAGIELTQSSSYTVEDYAINGNVIYGGAAASIPLYIVGATDGAVTGNRANAGTGVALYLSASPGTRISNNSLLSGGSVVLQTAGNCANSMCDSSNTLSGISGVVDNGGTGCNVRYFASATPQGGTNVSQVGDVAYNTAPTSTGSFLWVCTTAGTPGTWTSLTLP
jgi:parallel beta-helix repeat protein